MLLSTVFLIYLLVTTVVCSNENGKDTKPYVVYPLPVEMPNRNDRADQCWVRIEDIELTQMVTVYCYIAKAFLQNYIHDYNTRKMTEDGVDVSLWSEEPRSQNDLLPPKSDPASVKDWKTTTILDCITHMRIYVSINADCRLIMYSREGTSNYKVDCERILYYVNSRTSKGSIPYSNIVLIGATSVLLWFLRL